MRCKMDKQSIRKAIISKRDSIDTKSKMAMDGRIKDKLKESIFYKNSRNIFIYIGFGSEIDTAKYIEEFLLEGKEIFVPRTDMKNKVMEAVKINSLMELTESSYGILEPDIEVEAINKNDIDLVILPGVAFDKSGGRIGYGGGYYDKYLEGMNSDIVKLAITYDFQVLDEVPFEEHDIKADYIITECRDINLLYDN
ncbi:5-formyltetrahydrofolate cyclo-ligase [Clostridium paraputrificum]|uniref:5-formyltetrahydrofolate cyclo-ligase n=1 Tax=Clostridium paraputrificum TaxID=29363 RepID=UPI003D32C7B6